MRIVFVLPLFYLTNTINYKVRQAMNKQNIIGIISKGKAEVTDVSKEIFILSFEAINCH